MFEEGLTYTPINVVSDCVSLGDRSTILIIGFPDDILTLRP